MRPLLASAIALCTALPLHAETYKWVDAKGVTNYSNAPPSSAKRSDLKVVEDRISNMGTDPNFERDAQALRRREERRADYLEADWARRQQAMPMQQSYAYSEEPYYADYGWYGGYGGYYGGSFRRAAFFAAARRANRPTNPIANNGHGRPPRTIPSPILGAPRAPSRMR